MRAERKRSGVTRVASPNDSEQAEIVYVSGAVMTGLGYLLQSPKAGLFGLCIIGAQFVVQYGQHRALLKRAKHDRDKSNRVCPNHPVR